MYQKWTLRSLNLDMSNDANWGFSLNRKKGNDKESIQLPNTFRPRQKVRNGMANSIGPNETARYNPSHITKKYLYNVDPFKPYFYIVKLGITGVYNIFFYISARNIYCGYS